MDALKFFQIAGYVVPLIRSLIDIVKTMPGASDADQKVLVMTFLKSVWLGLQQNPAIKVKEINEIQWEAVEPILGLLVDGLVAIVK